MTDATRGASAGPDEVAAGVVRGASGGPEEAGAPPENEPDAMGEHEHGHILVDPAHDDTDWAWRRRIRDNPATLRVYRALVFVVGAAVTVGGLILVPLPGPGWAIVIVGLLILASEFEKAHRLLEFVKTHVKRWEEWLRPQAWWVKAGVALATCAFVCAFLWLTLRMGGVPTWLPDLVEDMLHTWAGL